MKEEEDFEDEPVESDEINSEEALEEPSVIKHFRRLIRIDNPELYFSGCTVIRNITDDVEC